MRPLSSGLSQSVNATRSVAETLRRAGHQVSAADPPYPKDLGPRFTRRWLPGIAEDARNLELSRLEDRTRRMARAGRALGSLGLAAEAPDARLAARTARWFEDHDALLTPTLTDPLLPVGHWRGKGWVRTMLGVANWIMTSPWNIVGYPAISIPAGTSTAGTPIGVQLVATPGGEARLLALAAQIERLTPWPRWQPPSHSIPS